MSINSEDLKNQKAIESKLIKVISQAKGVIPHGDIINMVWRIISQDRSNSYLPHTAIQLGVKLLEEQDAMEKLKQEI